MNRAEERNQQHNMEIRAVGVIGCGLMGSGIAQVLATRGLPPAGLEANPDTF